MAIIKRSDNPISNNRASGQPPASMAADKVKPKYRTIALARTDLVAEWRTYRRHHKRNGKKYSDIDREFIAAYKAGMVAPHLGPILGDVSERNIKRWDASLDGTLDWTLLVPQWGNGKAEPGLTHEEKAVFSNLLFTPGKLNVGSATKLTKYYLSERKIPSPSSPIKFRRWADWWKRKHFDRWVLIREGEKALKDQVEPFIRRDPSKLEVGDVLVADGHRLNFQVINPFTGKPCRAVLIGYVDWKSWDLAGYEIMVQENTQCIASALRNSLIRLGKVCRISYQDNGKAFRAKYFKSVEDFTQAGIYGLFGRLGIIPAFALPYNARAKIIERWFKEFTNTFERLVPSYVGTSIAEKPAYMLPNEKFHKALHNEYIPTIDEAIQYIEAWLGFHRSQPCPHVKGKAIGEVFDAGKGDGIDTNELDDLMMSFEESPREIRRNGITFLGQEYYDDNLYSLREKVYVKYSLFDLSYINVYSMAGEFICRAGRVQPVHPMAAYLGEAKDMEELSHKLRQQRHLKKQTTKAVKELLKSGSPAELDWQKVVEIAPRVAEEIENDSGVGNSEAGEEKRIPEEAVARENNPPCPPDPTLSKGGYKGIKGGNEETFQKIPDQVRNDKKGDMGFGDAKVAVLQRPIFRSDYERYEWHLSHGLKMDDDHRWVQYYETTDEFRMIYGKEVSKKIG